MLLQDEEDLIDNADRVHRSERRSTHAPDPLEVPL